MLNILFDIFLLLVALVVGLQHLLESAGNPKFGGVFAVYFDLYLAILIRDDEIWLQIRGDGCVVSPTWPQELARQAAPASSSPATAWSAWARARAGRWRTWSAGASTTWWR